MGRSTTGLKQLPNGSLERLAGLVSIKLPRGLLEPRGLFFVLVSTPRLWAFCTRLWGGSWRACAAF
jgi:hypothetical protein